MPSTGTKRAEELSKDGAKRRKTECDNTPLPGPVLLRRSRPLDLESSEALDLDSVQAKSEAPDDAVTVVEDPQPASVQLTFDDSVTVADLLSIMSTMAAQIQFLKKACHELSLSISKMAEVR